MSPAASDIETRAPKRVLLVEDDEIALRAVARQLERGGYQVVTATGVMRAREHLDTSAPDVVVSDVLLPDGSGLDVLDAARRRQPPLPVLLITGSADASTVATAFAAGVSRYLRKPLAAVELIDAVVQACRPRAPDPIVPAPAPPPPPPSSDRQLSTALAALELHLQPIASWSRSKVVAHEAHPRAGDLDRAGLRDAARVLGRASDLGRAVRAAVAARLATLPADAHLHVAVDGDDLADPELYADGAPLSARAAQVTLAITEDSARGDLEQTIHRLALLRSLGYRVAVAEVGSDGASLVALAALRPEVLALSPWLLDDHADGGTRQIVLRLVHQLAAQLGGDVVARGLDRPDQLASALTAGIDRVAGDVLAPAGREPATIDFARIRRQIGHRRHARTTHRAPSRTRAASAQAPDPGTIARALHEDLAAALAAASELIGRDEGGPELRRLVDQAQTLSDAIASLHARR
jgi:EAL domain-containing protein (putative c-di-GMP-specific phosphodiesterase class I)/ActR/RegA family two-component response regulator